MQINSIYKLRHAHLAPNNVFTLPQALSNLFELWTNQLSLCLAVRGYVLLALFSHMLGMAIHGNSLLFSGRGYFCGYVRG